mmetsp:Transcript_12013/g.23135  ORF Transcript_12013/g.23135 Transcript_12013/m.23135 type:complete len:95 (+) Transcript_12013:152-436(+)
MPSHARTKKVADDCMPATHWAVKCVNYNARVYSSLVLSAHSKQPQQFFVVAAQCCDRAARRPRAACDGAVHPARAASRAVRTYIIVWIALVLLR